MILVKLLLYYEENLLKLGFGCGNLEGRLREYFKIINFGEAKKKGISYGIKLEEIREGIKV
jgi:hypothetical protein